jgi:hypothetical protein
VDYLIPIEWSTGQEVAWFELPTAWRLNLCTEIIATILRVSHTGVFNLPQDGCWRLGAIDLILDGTGIVPPPIVHLVTGFVTHLPHI